MHTVLYCNRACQIRDLGDVSLIEESFRSWNQHLALSIQSIIYGTGYGSSMFESLCGLVSRLSCHHRKMTTFYWCQIIQHSGVYASWYMVDSHLHGLCLLSLYFHKQGSLYCIPKDIYNLNSVQKILIQNGCWWICMAKFDSQVWINYFIGSNKSSF